jgi:hypothetical protein
VAQVRQPRAHGIGQILAERQFRAVGSIGHGRLVWLCSSSGRYG